MTDGQNKIGYLRQLDHPDSCKGYVAKAMAIDQYGKAGITIPDIADANDRLRLDLRRQNLSMSMI